MRIKNLLFYTCVIISPLHAMMKFPPPPIEHTDVPYTATEISKGAHETHDKCMSFSELHNIAFVPDICEDSLKIFSEKRSRLHREYLFYSSAHIFNTNKKTDKKTNPLLPSAKYAATYVRARAPRILKKAVYDDRKNLFFIAHNGDANRALLAYTIDDTNNTQLAIKQKSLLSKKEIFKTADMVVLPECGLATLSRGKEVKIWDAATSKCLRAFKVDEPSAHLVSFSPYTFLTAEDWSDDETYIHQWDVRAKSSIHCYETPRDIQGIIATPNGFLTGEYDYQKGQNVIQEWDNRTGTVSQSCTDRNVSPDYSLPASIRGLGYYKKYIIALIQNGEKGLVKIWNSASMDLVQEKCINTGKIAIRPNSYYCYGAKFSWPQMRSGLVGSLLALNNGEFWIVNEANIVKLSLKKP